MTEHEHQVALFQWAALYERDYPELALLYANPLGGYRARQTGRLLKAEGLKKGVPDLTLPVPRHHWHGLYIEMKRPAGPNGSQCGRVTKAQNWWLNELNAQGYLAIVCYGWEEARDAILEYLRP